MAEGGGMVKELDFEAGIFFLNLKKNQIIISFLCRMAIIGLFSAIHGVSLHKTG